MSADALTLPPLARLPCWEVRGHVGQSSHTRATQSFCVQTLPRLAEPLVLVTAASIHITNEQLLFRLLMFCIVGYLYYYGNYCGNR